MANEDLKFEIGIEPDTNDFTKALDDLGKYADGIGGKAGGGLSKMLGGMGKAGGMPGGDGGLGGAMGGMAMMAGPAGMAVQAGMMALQGVGKGLSSAAGAAVGGLEMVGDGLKGLQQQLGPVGLAFDVVGAGLAHLGDTAKNALGPALGAALGPFIDAFAAVPGILKGITETLTQFAAKASPVTMEQFSIAIDDVQATIGQSFVPVLQLMTQATRLFGDVLANMLPSTQEVSYALEAAYDGMAEFRDAMMELATEVGPILRTGFIAALQYLGQLIRQVASYVTSLVHAMSPWLAQLRQFLGITGGAGTERTSTGASARSAQFQGIEAYQQQLQIAAMSAPGVATQQDMPRLTSEISTAINNVWDWLRSNVGNFLSNFWQQILTSILRGAQECASLMTGGLIPRPAPQGG